MTEALLEDIDRYIELLESHTGLYITFHNLALPPGRAMVRLAFRMVHNHPFCLCVKQSDAAWELCQLRRYDAGAERTRPYYCRCFAGYEEFVYPVMDKGAILGLICVGGFCPRDDSAAWEDMAKSAQKYNFSFEKLAGICRCHMRGGSPCVEQLTSAIAPLAHLVVLLHRELKEEGAPEMLKSDARQYVVAHVMVYLREHFSAPVRTEELARQCHCSVSYLSHAFKAMTGRSIRDYVNELRVEAARPLLKDKSQTVTQVGISVGFSDANYFSSAFRRYTGMTPTEYRRFCERQKEKCTGKQDYHGTAGR